jgi:phage-related protein
MADFPTLRTGAVMQYPAERELRFSTEVLQFVDGSEQRFRGYGAPLRRWIVRLDLLEDAEWKRLEKFFDASQGALGNFQFTDPGDGTVYADCSLEEDEMTIEFNAEQQAKTALVIRENRT